MPLELTPGAIYRRTELHQRYGGQRQGGISTPAQHPLILAFTGYAGGQHGYADGWSEGVFCYFGEGQQGDMQWSHGNTAIRDHLARGRDLLLFEMLREPRSHVRFLGPFACASWEYRQALDRLHAMRRVILFHLTPVSEEPSPSVDHLLRTDSLADRRARAIGAQAQIPSRSVGVAAICPNCHRQMHYGKAGMTLNSELARKIRALELSSDPAS